MDLSMKCTQLIYFTFVLVIFSSGISLLNANFVITAKEAEALEMFRPLVKELITQDYQTVDGYLVLWLRAQKLNIDDAVAMFTEAQMWRKRNRIDTILNETFPEFSSLISSFNDDGEDNQGRLVLTGHLGKFDTRAAILTGKRAQLHRLHFHIFEKTVAKAVRKVLYSNGTKTDPRLVSILDGSGFNLRMHGCFECTRLNNQITMEKEKYYPGVNAYDIYINLPRFAVPIFESLKKHLPEALRETVSIFSSDRTEWSKFVQSIVPSDQLRYQFGGTKKN